MKLKQAQQIIEHHLEWINNGKQSEYKYTEEAFNEALKVALNELELFQIVKTHLSKISNIL